MSFLRGIGIEGCPKAAQKIIINVDPNEPDAIGLDSSDHIPHCYGNSGSIVRLDVFNRGAFVTPEGILVADVHLGCPETRCPFHQPKNIIVNCYRTFPVNAGPDGHSVCFAHDYVANYLPPRVDLVPEEGGFMCHQANCPLHHQYSEIFNRHF